MGRGRDTHMTRTVRAGTYTVCLDTQKADEDTYPNWLTICVSRDATGTYWLKRLTNCNGNGQTWKTVGRIGETQLTWASQDVTFLGLSVATILARKWNVPFKRAVGVTFPKARIWNVSRMKTRKTAAPSLLRSDVRDKNKNNMREHVANLDMNALGARITTRNWKR